MRFAVLGPLLVERDGANFPLPRSAVLRGLLGVLLVAQGQPLPAGRLAELVWARRVGQVGHGSVHVGVSRLRHWLHGLHECPAGGDVVLVHDTRGYRLVVDTAAVDLWCFRDLLARSRATEDPGGRCELLRAAVGLCRGPVLADLDTLDPADPFLRSVQNEVRAAGLALADAALATGRPQVAVDSIEEHLRHHPLDEPVQARLIELLAASGRPAESLARYEALRIRLRDELGVDPSDEVRQAHMTVLAADQAATASQAGPVAGTGPTPPRPCLLPADTADFTGRDDQVQRLLRQLTGDRQPGLTAVPLAVITGRAGVGKTALAVRAAHLLCEAYPDGQLYVDLHGTETRPAEPTEVLARFLRVLGLDGRALPQGLDERAELYRDQLAGRRMLVVLDNASRERQVRPLLPGNPSCGVLVTSRRPLTGLGSRPLRLDVLDRDAAIELLGRIVGTGRVAVEAAAAADITGLCGRLPLAIKIAGGRLARLQHRSLAWLAARLADSRNRLNELALDDLEMRASLALSLLGLDRQAPLLFGRLSLLDTPEVPPWAAAALLDTSQTAVEECLDQLVDVHLVDVRGPDGLGQLRYHQHDLVRVYARERAEAHDPPSARSAAVLRALTGWLDRAREADGLFQHRFPSPADGQQAPATGLVTDPLAWFETERSALVSGVHQAYQLGADDLCWELASRLTGFFETCDHYDDWARTHRIALLAARRAGSGGAQAGILHRLGELQANHDRYDEALEHFTQARQILCRRGDRLAEAHVLRSAGVALRMLGRMDQAKESLQAGMAIFTEHGDKVGMADSYHGLGAIDREQGRLDEAADNYERALALFVDVGDQFTQAGVLCSLGNVWKLAGRHTEADRCLRSSLEISRGIGHRHGEAFALCYLGELNTERGDTELAHAQLDAARSLCEKIGERFGFALACRTLGRLSHATGDLTAGYDALTQALTIWTELDLPIWRARALEAIGDIQSERGNDAEARAAWRAALELFRTVQAPEADRVAGRIGELSA